MATGLRPQPVTDWHTCVRTSRVVELLVISHLLKIGIGTSGRAVVPAGACEATVEAVRAEVDAVRGCNVH